MELGLNQRPLLQIEERIRCLEGVIFRQHLGWLCDHTAPLQITSPSGGLIPTANVQAEGRVHQGEVHVDVEGGTAESGRRGKRKAVHLIAKALETEESAKRRRRNIFDCNICFEMAKNPVLTCCGHLFCWSCFYKLPYAYLDTKECPECNGEVTETRIIPIYGNEDVNGSDQLELKEDGSSIPARPRPPRVESFRQLRRNLGGIMQYFAD